MYYKITGQSQRTVLCVYNNQTLVLPDAFCLEDQRPDDLENCSIPSPETGQSIVVEDKTEENKFKIEIYNDTVDESMESRGT